MKRRGVARLTFVLTVAQVLVSGPRTLAHPPAPPVRGVVQFGDGADAPTTTVYGGYGYIAESEAEAYEALKLECRAEDLLEDHREYCGGIPASGRSADQLVDSVMEGLVLSDLRRHEAEFRIMQLRALGASDVALPDCLENTPDIETLFTRLPGTVPHWSSIESLPAPERELLNRYRIATSPLRSEEMVRALIYADHLVAAQLKLCSGSRLSEVLGTQCTSIENNLARLEASFPALLDSRGEDERKAIREGVSLLLAADIDQPLPGSERARIGSARYEAALEVSSPLTANSMEIKIADALLESEQARTPEPRRARLRGARDRINSGLAGLFESEIKHHQDALEDLCEQDSLNTYIVKQPQVVRQSLMDAEPRQRALMRLVLCDSPLVSGLGRRSSCDKVTLAPKTETTPAKVSVNRREWNYPYNANVNYEIEVPPSVPANQPWVISTQLKVRVDPHLTEDQITSKLGSMQSQMDAFFGCMSGERAQIHGVPGLEDRKACPPDPRMTTPPVRFKISVARTPPAPETPPVVGLHACFRAELPAPDNVSCDKVREFALKQCADAIRLWQRAGRIGGSSRYALPMEEFLTSIAVEPFKLSGGSGSSVASDPPDFLNMTAEEIQAHCASKNPPAIDGRYDRENAGNYTLNSRSGTVIHEMAHALGIPDEYQDPAYPFLPQGEHDSIMNASNHPQASFKSRHIKRLLEPLSCHRGLIPAEGL